MKKGGFGRVYQEKGVQEYYIQSGNQYQNPHKYDIERLIKKKLIPNHNQHIKIDDKILDLACGSGQVTVALQHLGYKKIAGIDPYTHEKFREVTGLACGKQTFLDILNGALDETSFQVIVISYALHLVKEGMMHDFCRKLAQITPKLIIISPHKFPVMRESYGWKEVENTVLDRVHMRVFDSLVYEEQEQKPQQMLKKQDNK